MLATCFSGLEDSNPGWLAGGKPLAAPGPAMGPPRPQPRVLAGRPRPPLDWSLKVGVRFTSQLPFAVAEAARRAPTRVGAQAPARLHGALAPPCRCLHVPRQTRPPSLWGAGQPAGLRLPQPGSHSVQPRVTVFLHTATRPGVLLGRQRKAAARNDACYLT